MVAAGSRLGGGALSPIRLPRAPRVLLQADIVNYSNGSFPDRSFTLLQQPACFVLKKKTDQKRIRS